MTSVVARSPNPFEWMIAGVIERDPLAHRSLGLLIGIDSLKTASRLSTRRRSQ